MSPNSNIGINEIISWKGQTFNQITSYIRKNGAVDSTLNIGSNIFKRGRPLKIYRREVVVPDENSCNERTSMRMDLLNAPGGSITNSVVNTGGLVNTIDFNLTENLSERPSNVSNAVCELNVGNTQSNALRRLRSGGMIKKQFDISTNKQTYYTNSQQYINSRNLSFNQNQYYYMRTGNTSSKPGDSLSTNNLYVTNTSSSCKQFYISAATSFQYQWINEPTYALDEQGDPTTVNLTEPAIATVDVPVGYYTIDELNQVLHNTMIANLHYYRRSDNNSNVFLMSFTLNEMTGLVELTVSPIDETIRIANNYSKAPELTELGIIPTDNWTTPTNTTNPQIIIDDNEFKNIIGFANGYYPSTTTNTVVQVISGTTTPLIRLDGNRVYYKPNNPQFAQQGAVSSSSKIARIKYDTITGTAASYTTAFGLHVSNALAYNVSATGYTIKDKLGYPNKNTPTVTTTGEMRFCK